MSFESSKQASNSQLDLNHEALSGVGLEFIQYAKTSDGFDQPLPVSENAESLYAKEYQFALQPMPVFVSNEQSQQMGKTAVDLFEVYKNLVLKLAKENPQLLGEYFESPYEKSLEELLTGHTGLEYCLLRGDFTMTDHGFKLMEFNVSGNLGGWGIFLLESLYREYPAVKKFLNEQSDINFSTYSPFSEMVKQIVTVSYQFTQGRKPNIAVFLGNEERLAQAQDMFGRVKQMMKAKGIDVEFTAVMESSKIEEVDGKLVTDNGVIDSMLLLGLAEQVPDHIYQKSERGEFPMFNGRAAHLLHQKSGLALLSEYVDWPECSAEEKALIDSSLPWTRLLREDKVKYQGNEHQLIELAKSNKDDFVLKPVGGCQGTGVCVGNRKTQEQWNELIDQALAEGDHIVQGFCLSQQLLGRSQDGELLPHDAVWAPFVFGGKFSGNSLRMQPSGHESGVINAHRGASDAFIFLHD